MPTMRRGMSFKPGSPRGVSMPGRSSAIPANAPNPVVPPGFRGPFHRPRAVAAIRWMFPSLTGIAARSSTGVSGVHLIRLSPGFPMPCSGDFGDPCFTRDDRRSPRSRRLELPRFGGRPTIVQRRRIADSSVVSTGKGAGSSRPHGQGNRNQGSAATATAPPRPVSSLPGPGYGATFMTSSRCETGDRAATTPPWYRSP